ncbi:MAG TPA: hypothetical protein VEA69_13270, partial [Tepidisphaeraceae bacterium]|nr:hypothetical protein [Tepidisphaeraceae bacterium]
YLGLFLIALATLMYEVLLTRIFSVTMYYHFAFVAVSVALFGMTLGAVIVYMLPGVFRPERARRQMAGNALWMGVTLVGSFVLHLNTKFASEKIGRPEMVGAWDLFWTYLLIMIPFVFSGVAICLALTKFSKQVSRLYAADLAGAAVGCLGFIVALRLTDGPTAVLVAAAIATTGGLCCALGSGRRMTVGLGAVLALGTWGLAGYNGMRVYQEGQARLEDPARTTAMAMQGRGVSARPLVRIWNGLKADQPIPLFEQWNAHSRIQVRKESYWHLIGAPSGWGMSDRYKTDPVLKAARERRGLGENDDGGQEWVRELAVTIDSGAGTYITEFKPDKALATLDVAQAWETNALWHEDRAAEARKAGNAAGEQEHLAKIEPMRKQAADLRAQAVREAVEAAREQVGYLKYDVTNFAHFLRPNADVLVIGAGGGRDLLSALVFDQKSVTGVEINSAIVMATRRVFGDFAGQLHRIPNLRVFNDEARSFITRMPNKVDVIQISLIDTWAATAAGAFVLSENTLYTTEAWRTFFDKLSDRGVLTVSRWYHPDKPGETLRIVALANQSLREMGVTDPRKHVVIVKRRQEQRSVDLPAEVANTIVCRSAFTDADLDLLEARAKEMGFDVVLSPRVAASKDLETIAGAADVREAAKAFPIDISPPTDDKPFFFNMTRMGDAFAPGSWLGRGDEEKHGLDVNLRAVKVVAGLLVFTIVLTGVLVVLPVLIKAGPRVMVESKWLSLFFVCIGLAFILVEIAQMQRLIILLGHPTYSLSVVLFAVLISGGIGSFLTRTVEGDAAKLRSAILVRVGWLVLILIITGLMTPAVIAGNVASGTAVRIAAALLLLMPAGVLMGMCFPLGMKVAAARGGGDLAAWLWGVNGAMSVIASVLAVVLAMSFGISASWWIGVGLYGVAWVAGVRAARA